MKKRVIALAIAAVSAISMLAGCSKINGSNAYDLKDYSQYVTVPAYTGLSIEVEEITVTEEQVQARIDALLEENSTYEKIETGTVKDKDSINMDFAGYYINDDGTKGKDFENGTSKGYNYTIGGNLIPSLNDQLIGLEVGKEYDLTCKFPDDYSNSKELAGQTVIFTVTVNYIKKPIKPEYTDAFVAEYTKNEYKTTADYTGKIREDLKAAAEETMQQNYQGLLWTKIIEDANITEYDEERLKELTDMYDKQLDTYIDYYAVNFGMEREDFLASDYCYYFFGVKSEEELDEMALDYAKSELEQIMVAVEISKKEGITVPKEEYQSQAESIVAQYDYENVADFEETYGRNFFLEGLILDKVTEFLLEKNTMTAVEATTPAQTEAEKSTEAETTTAAN